MTVRNRGLLAVVLNAALLGPALLASPSWPSAHACAFFLIVSVFAWIESETAEGHDVSTGRASWGAAFTGLALLAVFVTALLTAGSDARPQGVAIGGALMATGIALRRAAMRALGPRFVSELRPITARDRVRSGPYAWLDHPSEVGLLCIAAGAVIILGSRPAAILWGLWLAPLVVLRMRQETRALALWGAKGCRRVDLPDPGSLWRRIPFRR